MAGGFALLAAADFNAEEGVADGFNSSVMLWDAGGGEGGGEGGGGGGDRGEGRAHLTLLVRPVRPSALWRWISAHEIRLSVG